MCDITKLSDEKNHGSALERHYAQFHTCYTHSDRKHGIILFDICTS